MKPTEEQIKEFWERCGFKWVEKREYVHGYMMHGGHWYDGHWKALTKEIFFHLPPIDLNNLFKYAVPKLQGGNELQIGFAIYEGEWECWLYQDDVGEIGESKHSDDPALALFWAIWEAIK